MDLREFGPTNLGCVFEIQELLTSIPLDRLVFLIDSTTDRSFLEQSITRAWSAVPAGTVNRTAVRPELTVLVCNCTLDRDPRPVVSALISAAAGDGSDAAGSRPSDGSLREGLSGGIPG